MTDFREALVVPWGAWHMQGDDEGSIEVDLAGLPAAIREAIDLGFAWQEADAALPEGWRLDSVRRSRLGMKDQWVASYHDDGGWFNFYGDTPTAALRAANLKEQR